VRAWEVDGLKTIATRTGDEHAHARNKSYEMHRRIAARTRTKASSIHPHDTVLGT